MANQRYYITCPICKKSIMLGKSLGDGVYHSSGELTDSEKLEGIYEWAWEHMMDCHKDETKEGQLFTIESDNFYSKE